jgi:hypothetical protein
MARTVLVYAPMTHSRGRIWLGVVGALAATLTTTVADAKPHAPGIICETYPGAPACVGQKPDCKTCHEKTTAPVVMNAYGKDVSVALTAYIDKPFDNAAFGEYLAFALTDVEAMDSDGDGHGNSTELFEGTYPGDSASIPGEAECPEDIEGLVYPLCQYDRSFAYRKVAIDFCGLPPTFDEMEAFRAQGADTQDAELHAKLDACLDTQFWQGFDGVVWSLAHEKIRPLTAFFDARQNFFADYALFVWSQIDGNDVREMITADYHVSIATPLGDGDISYLEYSRTAEIPDQPLQQDRRAGMLTLAWPLFYNTMFTALPRTTAAQAYRAFLGLDIAKSEGLDWPIAGEPVDYDNAGVTDEVCAGCHSTLDPLAYPFATYNGLQADGEIGVFEYEPDRIEKHFGQQFPEMLNMPEAGYIFGQEVADLNEWAQVAANSDPFYSARAKDYWTLLMGEAPRPDKADRFAEFTSLWEGLRETNSIEDMLHQLIETEAYGAP